MKIEIDKISKAPDSFTYRQINNFTEKESIVIINLIINKLLQYGVLNLNIKKFQYNCVKFEYPFLVLAENDAICEIRIYNYNKAFYQVISVNSFIVPLRHIEKEVRLFPFGK